MKKGNLPLVTLIIPISELIVKSVYRAVFSLFPLPGLGPGRRSCFMYSRIASSVVSQLRLPILIPVITRVRRSLRMKPVVKPLIRAASVTEMSFEARSWIDAILALSYSAYLIFELELLAGLTID